MNMADGGDLPDLENAQKDGKFWPDSCAFSSNVLLVNKVKRKPVGGPQKPIAMLVASTCVEVKENAT